MITLLFLFLPLLNGPSSIIADADNAFLRQDYPRAITLYRSALQQSSGDRDRYWKTARAMVCYGDIVSPSDRERWYRDAFTVMKQAMSADSLLSNNLCWYAVALGYVSMYEGARSTVVNCRVIRESLDEAIKRDPHNDIAYSISGTFYRSLGNVSWLQRSLADLLLGGLPPGGFPEAEATLKEAVRLAPTMMRHRYELGLLYSDWGKNDRALTTFNEALSCPILIASDSARVTDMRQRINNLRPSASQLNR